MRLLSPVEIRRRRSLLAIAGCALLAIIAVASLLMIGIRHVPDFPTVRDRPEPAVTGRIALQVWDDQDGMCIDVEEIASGERRHVFCEGMPDGPFDQPVGISWFGWTSAGTLQLASYEAQGIRLVTYDVDSGTVVDDQKLSSETRPPDMRRRADGAVVSTTFDEKGRAEVSVAEPGGIRRVVFRTRGPDDYGFWSAEWSTLGDHVVVQDSERRWIVVRAEGDPVPRILATDAERVAWLQTG